MTCIAFDGKTVAADQLCSGGGRRVRKLHRAGNLIVGLSGELGIGMELLAWFKAGADPKAWPEHARTRADDNVPCLMVVFGKRQPVRMYDGNPYPCEYLDRKFAIGSGRDYALAALDCGRTASGAVRVAIKRDSNCGGNVDALLL